MIPNLAERPSIPKLVSVFVLLAGACGSRSAEPSTTPPGGTGTEPAAATAPAALAFTEAEDGGTVAVPAGQRFTLALPENVTTGYSWALELSPGLAVVSDEYAQTPGSEGRPGAGGTHTWTIEATAAGTQVLAGHYRRPWEDPPVDAGSFSLTVQVP
jgi:predicted secreted protein